MTDDARQPHETPITKEEFNRLRDRTLLSEANYAKLVRLTGKLKKRARQFDAILAVLPEGFFCLDRRGRLLEVNKALCRLTGWSKEALLHLSLDNLEGNAAAIPFEKRYERLQKVKFERYESRLARKNGQFIDVEISLSRHAEEEHILGFVRDISIRKLAETAIQTTRIKLEKTSQSLEDTLEEYHTSEDELYATADELQLQNEELKGVQGELKESQEHYQGLFQFAPYGYIITDAEGIVQEINRVGLNLLGLEERTTVGKPLAQFVARGSRGEFRREFKKCCQAPEGSTLEWEVVMLRNGRATFPAALGVTPIHSEDGGLNGFRWLLRDISERKQMDAELENHRHHLEEMVKERTEQLEEEIAGRELMEEELQHSEKKYRELVKYAPVGFYQIDFRTRKFTSVNDVVCEQTGYTRAELLGMSPFDILDKDSQALFAERIHRWLAGEKPPENVEYRVITKDGREIYTVFNVTFTRDEMGAPLGATVVGYDITERKQAEKRLADSERRFRELVQYAPVSIYQIDFRTNKFLSVNDVMCQQTGYPREELLQKDPADLLSKPSQVRFKERMLQWQRGEDPDADIEYQVVTKDGGEICVLLNVTFSHDEAGNPLAATVVAYDITARKQAEQAVQESRQKYQALIETTSDFIWEMDAEGRYTYCSPQMESLWGLKPEAMLGKTPFDLMLPEDKNAALEFFGRVASTHEPFSDLVTTALVAGGRQAFVETSGVPFFDTDGQFRGYRGISRDITVRKRVEREAAEARLEAERRADELEAIMEAIPVGMMITRDQDGSYISGNRAAHELLRVPPDEPNISKSAPDPDDRRSYKPMRNGVPIPPEQLPIQMAARGQVVRDWDCDLVFGNGDVSHVIVNGTPLYDENGQPRGAVAAIIDVTERQRAEEALRESEHRIQEVLESISDGFWAVDDQWRFTYTNKRAAQNLGHKPKDLLGKNLWETLPQLAGTLHEVNYRQTMTSRQPCNFEITGVLTKSAYAISVYPSGSGISVYWQDITERKKQESNLRRLNRTLAALSAINQSMVHATNEASYMEEVCRIVVEDCGHAMVWIGLAQDDEARSVKPVASAGFEEGYLDTLKVTWADTERGRGPTGTCIREGRVALCRNMLTDPNFKPWRKQAIKRGYASSISLPLFSEGKPFGALAIYSREPDPFTESELDLLGELASDLAYGITMIRTRIAHAQAEESLRQSEARFRTLADASFEGLVIHENGLLRDVNPRIKDMLGYEPAELIGKEFWEFIDEKYHQVVKQRVRKGSPALYEVELIHKNGRRVPVEVVGRSLTWNGRPARVSALRDITERKRAEAALRESEARYRSLFNGMTEGFALHEMIYDASGQPVDYRFIDVNPAFERLTGLKRKDVVGRTHNEVLPNDSPVWVEKYGKVALTGEPINFEDYSLELHRHYDVRAYCPAPGQFAVIFMDITERKDMEETLRVNLAKYTALFNSFPLGITVSDQDGKILETNREAARILGVSEKEHLQRNLDGSEWKIIRTDGTPMPPAEFASVRTLNEKIKVENQEMGIVKGDGQVNWISVTTAPLFVEGYGVVVTYSDITERKRLELDLLKTREQAEQRASELDTIFNSIADGVVVYDASGQAQQCNRVAVEILGFDPVHQSMGQLANKLSTRTMDGSLLRLGEAPASRALSGQTVTGERYIIQNPQKGKRIITTSSTPMWVGQRIAGAVSVMQDATDQYKAEEIQAWLASFPKLNPNPVTEMDASGGIHYLNPASLALFPDIEIKGKDHPWLAGLETVLEEIRSGGHPALTREVQVGENYYLQAISIEPQNGRVRAYGFEITKRKRAEKALERSNERLALMTETVGRLLASSEPQQVVEELCNKVLTHLDCHVFINYLVDENAGRLHLNASGGISDRMARRIEWLDIGAMVCGAVARDGVRIVAEDIPIVRDPRTDLVRGFGVQAYACHPLIVQGKVIGTLSFGTRTRAHFSEDDLALMKAVTDHVAIAMGRHQAEQAVIQARDELEQRVFERTRELSAANEQLEIERQRFNDVLDHLPAYLVLLTPDYHVSFANRYFESHFGKSEGRRCYEYLFNRTEPCEICDTYKTLKEDRPQHWEWTGPDQRNYDIHDFPFIDVDGSKLILEMGIDITERKQAESELDKYRQHLEELVEERTTELQKERANLQKIFDVVNVGMLLVGRDGSVKRINDVIRHWTGKDGGDLEPLQPGDALGCINALSMPEGCGHSEFCSTCRIRSTFESVIRTGKPRHGVEVESTLLLDGKKKRMWLDISADPLEVDGERHVILALSDVTARKAAEQALRQARDELEQRVQQRTQELSISNNQLLAEVAERRRAEEELRLQTSAMEAAANGIIITDCDGAIQWCNPAFSQITGYNYVEVIGKNPRLLKSGKQDQKFYEQMWQTLLSGQVWRGELVNKRKSGELYVEEEIITPVRDAQGEISHFIAVKQDISSRKQSEEALRLANAYNRSLIEASLDPLATITPAGKIGDVNSATEKVTGRSRQELIGTDFSSFFSDPLKARLAYQKVFETGSVHDYELEIRHADGHVTPVLYNGSVYRDESDKVQGVFAVSRDITDRKQFESQLMQAEKHAVIGRMVGSVTHEINNPLQTIKNCLYLIRQDVPAGSSIEEPLDMATSETARLTDLVGQLRELYRPRSDSQDHPHEVLDILEEVHALLTPHLNNSKVKWTPLTGMRRCYINCVRDQILEVFLNISMNAIEAMKSTGGVLSVGMNIMNDQVGVVFRDSGPGVSEEILPHIFEPFTTTKSSGLGLGLSISYGIIQRHGGQIMVENCPEGGASFTIWLPVVGKNKKEKRAHAIKR